MKGKNVLTTGDVAKICNVAPRTVSKWFDSGQLKGYRIPGSKDRRIPLRELVKFMKAHEIPTSGLSVGPLRILIVDSNREVASELQSKIQSKSDYEVQTVRTTFETGVVAHKFDPHILMINLLSAGIDAHCICQSIRSSKELQTMKILAITNQLSVPEAEALLKNGYDDHIRLNSQAEEVIKKIEELTAIVY